VTNFSLLGALARGEAPDRAAINAARPVGGLRRLHVYELVEAAGQFTGLAASADAASRCREALVARFIGVFACASGKWPAIRVRETEALTKAKAYLKACMRAARSGAAQVDCIEDRQQAGCGASGGPLAVHHRHHRGGASFTVLYTPTQVIYIHSDNTPTQSTSSRSQPAQPPRSSSLFYIERLACACARRDCSCERAYETDLDT